jgi:hypothetical protein
VIVRGALLAVVASLTMSTARAATPQPEEVDAELLEFLGSLDVEEDGWQEYLEQKPVKAPVKQPQASPPPKRATDPKQVKDK